MSRIFDHSTGSTHFLLKYSTAAKTSIVVKRSFIFPLDTNTWAGQNMQYQHIGGALGRRYRNVPQCTVRAPGYHSRPDGQHVQA